MYVIMYVRTYVCMYELQKIYKTEWWTLIPDFGVSKAILNPADTFRRWCKLNFGLLRGHVKSRQLLQFY